MDLDMGMILQKTFFHIDLIKMCDDRKVEIRWLPVAVPYCTPGLVRSCNKSWKVSNVRFSDIFRFFFLCISEQCQLLTREPCGSNGPSSPCRTQPC